MNIVKTKLRNRMGPKLLDSILAIRYGLKRSGACCADYKLSDEVLRNISNSTYYPTKVTEETDIILEDMSDLISLDGPITLI